MAHVLTEEERKRLIEIMNSAEPFDDNDPIMRADIDIFDGDYDHDRMMATLAKLCLEGKI